MKSYEERMRDERDEAIADLERQVAALTKGRDLAVKQVGDVARQLGLCQIQRDELAEQVATLKYDLMVQTESCKQLGHIVAEKDSERIQFREQVTALKVELNHRSAELTGAFHQLAAVVQQRDELLAALKNVVEVTPQCQYGWGDLRLDRMVFIARAAIAKVQP